MRLPEDEVGVGWGPGRVVTEPPDTSITAGRSAVRSSMVTGGPAGSRSCRKNEAGKANQWLRNSSPTFGWAMYRTPQPPRASAPGSRSRPASVRWKSAVATGGGASSRRIRPARSSSRRRSAGCWRCPAARSSGRYSGTGPAGEARG